MYKIKHRVSAFLLSAFVVFGTVCSQYLTVQAFDWVAPSVYLPFDGAIPYLMGLLGVAPSENSLFTEDDYKEYLLENGYTEEDLENENGKYADWVDDVCNGALNQASEYWTKFKQWVTSKINSSSGDIIAETINLNVSGANIVCNYANLSSTPVSFVININSNGRGANVYLFPNDTTITYNSRNDTYSFSNASNFFTTKSVSNTDTLVTFTDYRNINFESSINNITNMFVFNIDYSSLIGTSAFENIHTLSSSNSDLKVYNQELIDNLSFALNNAISSAIPDVIPLPWDQIGENVNEITDTIDSLIEQVNTGVISISAYMQAVLDLIGAIAVDTTTDLVYPQNPDKPDETIDDKTDANKENQGFTLLGLEKVFPFCIPFDIYAFMTLLVAEPVAPVINWPVYNPITQENEIITIDFSIWDSVVVLFRYIFDFLFIIGLLLMARALIGGGDSA